ncbi:MAG: AAA family ATPase [Bacteroidaceae bacterium]|nr:AAA family ATPase [Bacteroidaceae bacterium]
MLERFTVENYKNFQKPITLDFLNTHDYQYNSDCVSDGILSKIIIYGPNASGKSNLGFALFDIVVTLTDKNRVREQVDVNSFLNADSGSKVARFEYCFKKGSEHIKYIYKKTSPTEMAYEEMRVDEKLVFRYDFLTQEHDFAGMNLIHAENLNMEYFESSFPILRYVANNTIQSGDSYVKFIMSFVSNMLWFRSLQNNAYIGLTVGGEDVGAWIVEQGLVSEFQQFMKKMAGIDKTLEGAILPQLSARPLLMEKHKNKSLLFDANASSGTKTLQIYFYWSKRFKDVSFLYIDEFDAFYHFDLAWNIVKAVSEQRGIQAIFTTHNTYLASNALLRPDCYFKLRNGKIVSFANSTSRELREGHNLEKMLRNGEFDA